MINVQYAILLIIVKNNLMEINLENAFAKKVIMMMVKIIYAKNALNFGMKRFFLFLILK